MYAGNSQGRYGFSPISIARILSLLEGSGWSLQAHIDGNNSDLLLPQNYISK